MGEKKIGELEQPYQKLESNKTLLMKLDETVAWSESRPILEKLHDKARKNKGATFWVRRGVELRQVLEEVEG